MMKVDWEDIRKGTLFSAKLFAYISALFGVIALGSALFVDGFDTLKFIKESLLFIFFIIMAFIFGKLIHEFGHAFTASFWCKTPPIMRFTSAHIEEDELTTFQFSLTASAGPAMSFLMVIGAIVLEFFSGSSSTSAILYIFGGVGTLNLVPLPHFIVRLINSEAPIDAPGSDGVVVASSILSDDVPGWARIALSIWMIAAILGGASAVWHGSIYLYSQL